MNLEQTWRWFGPNDPISLQDIKQTGATGIVTALHHLRIGEIWHKNEILERKEKIEKAGLRWSVVESIPVHEDIKRQTGQFKKWLDNYKKSISNLGKCGIQTVCYNFMPVLDWTRTDLEYTMPDGSTGLRFEEAALAAFDLFILKRPDAEKEYSTEIIQQAEKLFRKTDSHERKKLSEIILAGLPGSEEGYTLDEFREKLASYNGITADDLRLHLAFFLEEVIPVAEKAGIRMAIHPDDPPFSLFGLPRVVSTESDLLGLLTVYDSPFNGWTLCTGSFAACAYNDLEGMVKRLGHRINFLHLRNIKIEHGKTFHEADHLNGDVDMAAVMKLLLTEMSLRANQNRSDVEIPMRPDHGYNMLCDSEKDSLPGYSCIGRMRGLAELRGLEMGLGSQLMRS